MATLRDTDEDPGIERQRPADRKQRTGARELYLRTRSGSRGALRSPAPRSLLKGDSVVGVNQTYSACFARMAAARASNFSASSERLVALRSAA